APRVPTEEKEEGGAEKKEGEAANDTERTPHTNKGRKRKPPSGELMASRWRKKRYRKSRAPDELPNAFYANPIELSLSSASVCLYDKVLSFTLSLTDGHCTDHIGCTVHIGCLGAPHTEVQEAGLEDVQRKHR